VLDLLREGFGKDRLKLMRSVAIRYAGQSFEIDIPWSNRFEAGFHDAHRERYGYADNSRAIEIVSLRLRAAGVTQKPRIKRQRPEKPGRVAASRIERVYLNERAAPVSVYERDQLSAGTKLDSPAIITEYSSTTLIPKGFTVEVDSWLNLVIEVA
jgi:N-methylhydantoinase A